MFQNGGIKIGYATDQSLVFTLASGAVDPGSILGYTIQFDFVQFYGQSPTMFTLTTGGGGVTIQDGLTRQFTVNVTKANSTLPRGQYYYQAYRADPGNATLFAYGPAVIVPP